MKKHIFQSILVALALTTATLAAQAQDTPKTLTQLQTQLAASGNLASDVAVERLATLSAAAGALSDADFQIIDAAIVAQMLGRTSELETWNSDKTSVTISTDKVVVISGSINVSGTITVSSGKTLVVLPKDKNSKITSTSNTGKNYLFYTKGGTILLKGKSKDIPLIVDGGATAPTLTHGKDWYTYVRDNISTINPSDSGTRAFLVYVLSTGGFRSTYTNYQNNWRTKKNQSSDDVEHGNAVGFKGDGGSTTTKFNTSGFYGCKFTNLMNIGRNTRSSGVGTFQAVFNKDFNPGETDFIGGIIIGNCTFDGNASVEYYGSTLNYGQTSDCKYTAGGGAVGCNGWGKDHSMYIWNTTFKNNFAGWFGGAIFWNNSSPLILKECTFTDNTGGLGGAVYIEGACRLTDNKFTGNYAKQMNSTPYQSGNGFDGCGGAVYARSCNSSAPTNCNFSMKGNNVFRNNEADLDGGAIDIYFDKSQYNKGTSATKDITYTVNIDEDASGNSASFSENIAYRCGGAIAVVESPDLYGNESSYTLSADINFNDGKVDKNEAKGTKYNSNSLVKFNEPGDGGGIYAEFMNLNIGDGFSITNNKAANNGGGIYSRGNSTYGNITVGDAVITGNKATASVGTTVTATIKTKKGSGAANGTYGTQQGNGGAICIWGGSFTMNGGTLGSSGNANEAAGNGGCVFVTDGAEIELTGGTVSYNKATLNGGGFFIDKGTAELSGGSILHNEATKNGGGVYACNEGTVSLEGGDVSNNTALNGGGLYLNTSAQMTMSDGVLSNNTATGKTFTMLSLTTANGNTSTNEGVGGGIYLAPGTSSTRTKLEFNVSGTIGIYNNEATNAADDVFADQSNTCVIIPEVQFMNLTGLTRSADGWYEDYATNDADYDNGFKMKTTGDVLRFRDAIANDKNIWKVIVTSATTTITDKYVALTMGVSNGELVINASGLKPGESILVTIERPMQNGDNPSNYASNKDKTNYTVTLTGDADGKATVKMANLMVGWYELKRSPWAWAYSDEGEYKATTSTATSGDDIAKHLDGKAGSTTINKDIGSTATDGILAADVNYKSTTYGFFKVEPIEPLPLNGEATINNKFVTTTP